MVSSDRERDGGPQLVDDRCELRLPSGVADMCDARLEVAEYGLHFPAGCAFASCGRPKNGFLPALAMIEQQDCSMLDWTSAANGALLLRRRRAP